MERRSLRSIGDDELLARLAELLLQSRRVESDLVAHIAEVDERKLYAREASPSMFAYCTDVLHLSEAEAYLRIAAARACREHPLLLEMLADGRLHLCAVGKLAPHLTRDNAAVLLARAEYRTKRQIEELIAEIAPRPDTPTALRKLPQRSASAAPGGSDAPAAASGPAPAASGPLPAAAGGVFHLAACSERIEPSSGPHPIEPPNQPAPQAETGAPQLRPDAVGPVRPRPTALIEPLAVARYKVQFTASASLKAKLERLRALMRSQVSDGDLGAVIEAAVSEKLERLEAKRFGRTSALRKTLEHTLTAPHTRHIPAAVRRAVHERDGSRCRYVDAMGRRCPERDRLEFHHRFPFGNGGDHSQPNVALLCRAHNQLMAQLDYGSRTRAGESGRSEGRDGPPEPLRQSEPIGADRSRSEPA